MEKHVAKANAKNTAARPRLERKYRQIARARKEPLQLSPVESKALFAERRARIIAFSNLNTRRPRWIALAWVIDELSTRLPDGSKTAYRDNKREAEVIRHIQAAIRGGDFSRVKPGDMKHERLLFLSPSEPFHFISRDEAISIGDIPNVDHARDVIGRMWAPRDALAMLFKRREWRLPPWLIGVSASRSLLKKLRKPVPKKGPRRAARLALDAIYPQGVPINKTGQELTNEVNRYIGKQPSDLIEGRVKQEVSLDTVLRAAERK